MPINVHYTWPPRDRLWRETKVETIAAKTELSRTVPSAQQPYIMGDLYQILGIIRGFTAFPVSGEIQLSILNKLPYAAAELTTNSREFADALFGLYLGKCARTLHGICSAYPDTIYTLHMKFNDVWE